MNNELQTISIQLLGKAWQLRCSADQTAALQKSAQYLDDKLREMTGQSRGPSNERIITMGAIQAIYELQAQGAQKDLYIESLSSHIRELQNKLASHTQAAV